MYLHVHYYMLWTYMEISHMLWTWRYHDVLGHDTEGHAHTPPNSWGRTPAAAYFFVNTLICKHKGSITMW
jgi:hypothetical protein